MITLINKKLANRKGFTLIELLVVLAVLAIIALIAIPNFLGIQAQSKAKSDLETCNTVQDALRIFLTSENANVTAGTSTITVTGEAGKAASVTFSDDIKDIDGNKINEKKLEKYLDLNKVKFQTNASLVVTYKADSNGNVSHNMKINDAGTGLEAKTTTP